MIWRWVKPVEKGDVVQRRRLAFEIGLVVGLSPCVSRMASSTCSLLIGATKVRGIWVWSHFGEGCEFELRSGPAAFKDKLRLMTMVAVLVIRFVSDVVIIGG